MFQPFVIFFLMGVFFLEITNEISVPVMNRGRISPHGNSGIVGVGVGSGDGVDVDEGVGVVWDAGVGVGVGVGVGDDCGSSEL